MATIKLKSFHPQQARMVIKHPATGETDFQTEDGETIQGILMIAGYDSPEFVKAVELMEDARLKNTKEWNMDLARKENRSLIAATIVDWEDNGFFSESYTAEGADEFVRDPQYSWIVVQLAEFLEDKRNFFIVPPLNSATT